MEAKRERLRAAAEKARERSEQHSKAAHDVIDHIPFGQPILVGHHSEKAHRNALKRSWRHMGRMLEESGKAQDLDRRAEGIRGQSRARQSRAALLRDSSGVRPKLHGRSTRRGLRNDSQRLGPADRPLASRTARGGRDGLARGAARLSRGDYPRRTRRPRSHGRPDVIWPAKHPLAIRVWADYGSRWLRRSMNAPKRRVESADLSNPFD